MKIKTLGVICLSLFVAYVAQACINSTTKEPEQEQEQEQEKIGNHGNFQLTKDIEWEYAGEGVTRKIMGYNEDMMTVAVKFEKGAVGAMHTHKNTQASYIVSGKFQITMDDKVMILEAGDGFFAYPDQPHSCVAIEAGVLIDTFNPAREDFL